MSTPQDPWSQQPPADDGRGWGEPSPGPDLRKQPARPGHDDLTQQARPVPPAYGQPAYAQPSPYGQPAPQPGQPWGGPPQPTNPYGLPTTKPPRPGTVIAAAVTTFVFAGLSTVFLVIGGLFALFGAAMLVGADDGTEVEGLGDGLGMAVGFVAFVLLGFAVISGAAVVLAVYVLKGSSGARIGLVVMSSLSGVVSVIGMLGAVVDGTDPATAFFSLVWAVASFATVVLLFTGGANAWFAAGGGRNQAVSAVPGYGGPAAYGGGSGPYGGPPPGSWG